MKLKLFFLTILAGASLFAPAATRAQAPMFFDDFLFDNGGQPAENFNLFFQWRVVDGSVDLVGGNVPGAPEPPAGRFIDLGGSTGNPGEFRTTASFVFTAGTNYRINFRFASTDRRINTATVTIGSKVFPFSTNTNTKFRQFSRTFSFTETTTAPLVFQDLGNDNSGVGIDRVMLEVVALP